MLESIQGKGIHSLKKTSKPDESPLSSGSGDYPATVVTAGAGAAAGAGLADALASALLARNKSLGESEDEAEEEDDEWD